LPYSILNACVGSILQARSAGTALATAAVKRRLVIVAAKTAGSNSHKASFTICPLSKLGSLQAKFRTGGAIIR